MVILILKLLHSIARSLKFVIRLDYPYIIVSLICLSNSSYIILWFKVCIIIVEQISCNSTSFIKKSCKNSAEVSCSSRTFGLQLLIVVCIDSWCSELSSWLFNCVGDSLISCSSSQSHCSLLFVLGIPGVLSILALPGLYWLKVADCLPHLLFIALYELFYVESFCIIWFDTFWIRFRFWLWFYFWQIIHFYIMFS